jgi:hypothetical protein
MLTISVCIFYSGLLIGWFWAKYYYTKGEGKPQKPPWDMYSGGPLTQHEVYIAIKDKYIN